MSDSWRFIDIPKTASMTIREALGVNHKATMHWPAAAFPEVSHLFAVIREPLDRLVSCFAKMFAMRLSRDIGLFRRWVANDLLCNDSTIHQTPRTTEAMKSLEGVWFALPQVAWIESRVNLLRFDQLPDNVYAWCRRHGIPCKTLQRTNISDRLSTRDYYDEATEAKCREVYSEDFALWESLTNG